MGPLAGGAAAGLIYDFLLASNSSVQKFVECVSSPDFDDDKFPARKVNADVEEQFEVRNMSNQ